MDRNPLVSIITIVYNGEKYLEHVLQSIRQQRYPRIEYIVVDGGSTDNTIAIIKKNEDIISKWTSGKDKGISDAFNKGIRLAEGDIIGIINSDDWYEPDTVETVVQNFQDTDIVFGNMRLWKNGKADFTITGDAGYLENEMSINHPTVFVDRKCYEQFGLFDLSRKCAMDYDMMLRLKVDHCRFKHIPRVLANMRWEGLSDEKWFLGCKESLAIKNKYLPQKKIKNRLYFLKHITAIAVTKAMQKIKLGPLVKLYRSRLSRIKKEYE